MQDPIERQAAIEEISQYASIWMEYDTTMSLEEVAEAALKAAKRTMVHILEELPSAQPSFSRDHENDRSAEPCEDAVSRKWLIEAVEEGWIRFDTEKDHNRYMHLVRDIAPSAQPERKCLTCGRTANNGGWYADGRTRCPIEEHYALPKDGYCHLWEKRNVTDDDYPERREE